VFWDFDGVIKDTVNLKGEAFAELFRVHGEALAGKIRKHHTLHGGVSRMKKIPLYLKWAGLARDPITVGQYCERFAGVVYRGVMEAPWVPGAEDFLRRNPFGQKFFLVTATPQKEVETILAALDLAGSFDGIWGAPTIKSEAIRKVLAASGVASDRCLLVGDSLTDHQAALATNIPFLLREHADNRNLPWNQSLPCISDFLNL